ncbi:MAG: hypothetical protein H8E92_07415, partial [SAR86 cluster bacterium]|nr:hypothetical protein [SAR86 cluster bacterium]
QDFRSNCRQSAFNWNYFYFVDELPYTNFRARSFHSKRFYYYHGSCIPHDRL